MTTRKISTSVVLVFMVLLVVGAAAAERPGRDTGGPDFLAGAPAERMQEWRDGFLRWMTAHRDLTWEQMEALQSLVDLDDPSLFARVLDPNRRAHLSERLRQLGQTLSYEDYLQAVRSLDGELRVWLVHNRLASSFEADTPVCNCADSEDCSGATCQNVTCIHEAGTSHRGRCPGGGSQT